MSEIKNSEEKINHCFAFLISSLLVFVFQYICDFKEADNIITYICSCAIFIAFYFGSFRVFSFFMRRFKYQEKKNVKVNLCFCLFLCLGAFIWMYISYAYEISKYSYYTKDYIRHQLPSYLWFFFLFLGSILIFSFARNVVFSFNMSRFLRLSIASCFVFLQGKCLYHPNLFRGGEGIQDLLHIDTYTSSIINICNGASYSSVLNSSYGRYAFFYVPIVKFISLFTNEWFAVSLSISFIGAFMFALFYLLLNFLIKNDIIFFLAVVASGMPTFEMIGHQMYEVYYQVLPHRMLLQIVGLLGIYVVLRRNSIKNRVIMWFLVAFGLLWNIETGIVLLVVWSLFEIVLMYRERNWRQMVHVFFMDIYAVLFAFLFMNLLNLAAGGEWQSVGTFFYPFLPSTKYSFEEHTAIYLGVVILFALGSFFLPRLSKKDFVFRVVFWVFSSFLLIAGLILFGVFKVITSSNYSFFGNIYSSFGETYKGPFSGGYFLSIIFLLIICVNVPRIIKRSISNEQLFSFSCAILGLGCLTYHYECCHTFSLILVMPEAVILFSLIFGKLISHSSEGKIKFNPEYLFAGIIVMFLSCMAFESLAALPTKWRRESESVWVSDGITPFIKDLNENIPEKTLCFGVGIPQVCAYMGRDTGIFLQERSNSTKEATNYLQNVVNDGEFEYIFTNDIEGFSGALNTPKNRDIIGDKYEEVKSFDYMDRGEFIFYLYKKKLD